MADAKDRALARLVELIQPIVVAVDCPECGAGQGVRCRSGGVYNAGGDYHPARHGQAERELRAQLRTLFEL